MILIYLSIINDVRRSLNKTLLDDKGSTLIAVFGLPPLAHHNDPARALLAALTMQHTLEMLGMCGTLFSVLWGTLKSVVLYFEEGGGVL